jgi:hypothetical protein
MEGGQIFDVDVKGEKRGKSAVGFYLVKSL